MYYVHAKCFFNRLPFDSFVVVCKPLETLTHTNQASHLLGIRIEWKVNGKKEVEKTEFAWEFFFLLAVEEKCNHKPRMGKKGVTQVGKKHYILIKEPSSSLLLCVCYINYEFCCRSINKYILSFLGTHFSFLHFISIFPSRNRLREKKRSAYCFVFFDSFSSHTCNLSVFTEENLMSLY